MTQVQGQT